MPTEWTDAMRAELAARVAEVLYYIWDPIRVRSEPRTFGEYRTYESRVVELLLEGASAQALSDHLRAIEEVAIDCSAGEAARTGELLVRWRDLIEERATR